jgi:hypothetical protein
VKLAEQKERLDGAGGGVLVVGFEEASRLAWLRDGIESPFTFVVDRDRVAYQAFSLARASWARTYLHPSVVGGYARMLTHGQRPNLHLGQDRRQLGGDVVLDSRGQVVFSHPERGPEDRSPVGAIVRAALEAD